MSFYTKYPKVPLKKNEDPEKCEVWGIKFAHCYNELDLLNPDKEPIEKYHSCLREGYWCWKNFIHRPQDIIAYLKRKLR